MDNSSPNRSHIKSTKKSEWLLFLVAPVCFFVDYLRWSPNFMSTELWITVFIFVFSFLEYINYFDLQLSYDNVADLKFLIKTRRLKEAYMKKDMKRSS